MAISVVCPQCTSPFRYADKYAGRTTKCVKCGAMFVIQASTESSPPPTPPTPPTPPKGSDALRAPETGGSSPASSPPPPHRSTPPPRGGGASTTPAPHSGSSSQSGRGSKASDKETAVDHRERVLQSRNALPPERSQLPLGDADKVPLTDDDSDAGVARSNHPSRPPVNLTDQGTGPRRIGGRGAGKSGVQRWREGEVILDLYEIESFVGEGALSADFDVLHRGWNLAIRIKSPPSAAVTNPQLRDAFAAAGELWTSVPMHHHVGVCFYVRKLGGVPYLLREVGSEGTLSDWLLQGHIYEGSREEVGARLIDLGIQVARGLRFAHKHGVRHGHVHPGVVEMMPDGSAKVVDFGLAHVVSVDRRLERVESSDPRDIAGPHRAHPAYIAPEAREAERPTERGDFWGWALTLLSLHIGEVIEDAEPSAIRELLDRYEAPYLRRSQPNSARSTPAPRSVDPAASIDRTSSPGDAQSGADSGEDSLGGLVGDDDPFGEDPFGDDPFGEEPFAGASGGAEGDPTLATNDDVAPIESAGPGDAKPSAARTDAAALFGDVDDILADGSGFEQPDRYDDGAVHALFGDGPGDEAVVDDADAFSTGGLEPIDELRGGTIGDASAESSFAGFDDLDQLDLPELEELADSAERPADGLGEFRAPDNSKRPGAGSDSNAPVLGARRFGDGSAFPKEGQPPKSPAADRNSADESAFVIEGNAPLMTERFSVDENLSLEDEGDDPFELALEEDASDGPAAEDDSDPFGLDDLDVDEDDPFASVDLSSGPAASPRLGSSGDESAESRPRGAPLQDNTPPTSDFSGRGGVSMAVEAGVGTTSEFATVEGERIPRAPRALIRLMRRCLTVSEEERPADWDELIAELLSIYEDVAAASYRRQDARAERTAAATLNNRAVARLEQEDLTEGWTLLEQSLAASEEYPLAVYNMGLLLWRRGKIRAEKLLNRLDSAVAKHPESWTPHYLSGLVHAERGQAGAARAAFAEARKRAVGDMTARRAIEYAESTAQAGYRCLHVLRGHDSEVHSIAMTPDARVAATASYDKTARLWDLPAGRSVRVFKGHSEWVSGIAITSDGRLVATASWDRTVRLWEAGTGRCVAKLQGHDAEVHAVALSSDGRVAISVGNDNRVCFWDAAAGHLLHARDEHDTAVFGVALSANARVALTGDASGEIAVWHVAEGRRIGALTGHRDGIGGLSLSSDGRIGASGSWDGTVCVWDVRFGRGLQQLKGHRGRVNSVSLSPGGKRIISGGEDRTLRVWDSQTGRCIRVIEGHKDVVNAVALSIDGRYAVSGSGSAWDGKENAGRVWQIRSDLPSAPFSIAFPPKDPAFEHNRSRFVADLQAVEAAMKVRDWKTAVEQLNDARSIEGFERAREALDLTGQLVERCRRGAFRGGWRVMRTRVAGGGIHAVTVSPDGGTAYAGNVDGTIRVFDVESGKQRGSLEGHRETIHGLALSASGDLLVSGSRDNLVKVWNVETRECIHTLRGHEGEVHGVAITADGRGVASAGWDTSLRLWDAVDGSARRVYGAHARPVEGVACSVDGGRLLSASWDGTLRVWDARSAEPLGPPLNHESTVTGAALSARGERAASSSWDKTVRIWDVAGGRCTSVLQGHEDKVNSVAMSPDGRVAVSGSTDRTVRVWDADEGTEVACFEEQASWVSAVAISPDGRTLVAGGEGGVLAIWHLDWELLPQKRTNWEDGIQPYLEAFLTSHETKGLFGRMRVEWADADFQLLVRVLRWCGFGHVRAAGILRKLGALAKDWESRSAGDGRR